METLCKTISPQEDGSTVRHILRTVLHFSAHGVSRLAHAPGAILVNGAHARTTYILHTGDVLAVASGDLHPPRSSVTPGNWPLPIMWEDAHLLVVDKPAGMTAHASIFSPDTPTVGGALAYLWGSDFIFHPVNRLDRGTTGLMVVAKSGYIHDQLRKALHSQEFHREYQAVCLGCPDPISGVIDRPIGRDERSIIARMVRPDGAASQSGYQVLQTNGQMSLVHLMPQTGRTHQLRVHMASIGCPLAGDWLYGTEDAALIDRPALHAWRLELIHPVTGERLSLSTPLPPDMNQLVQQISKPNL